MDAQRSAANANNVIVVISPATNVSARADNDDNVNHGKNYSMDDKGDKGGKEGSVSCGRSKRDDRNEADNPKLTKQGKFSPHDELIERHSSSIKSMADSFNLLLILLDAEKAKNYDLEKRLASCKKDLYDLRTQHALETEDLTNKLDA